MKLFKRSRKMEGAALEGLLRSARPQVAEAHPDAALRLFERALAESQAPAPSPAQRPAPLLRSPSARAAFATAACGLAAAWFAWFAPTSPPPYSGPLPRPTDKAIQSALPPAVRVPTARLPRDTRLLVPERGPEQRNDHRPYRTSVRMADSAVPRYHPRTHPGTLRMTRVDAGRHTRALSAMPVAAVTPRPVELSQVLVVTAENTEPAVRVNSAPVVDAGFSRVAVLNADDDGNEVISECTIAQAADGGSNTSYAVTPAPLDGPEEGQPYLSVEANTPATPEIAPAAEGGAEEIQP